MSGTPRRKAGLLAPQVEDYRSWLAQHGYTPQTTRNMLKDLGQVGLWLSKQGLDARDLNEVLLKQHLSDLRKAGRRRVAGPRGMVPPGAWRHKELARTNNPATGDHIHVS